MPGSSDPSTIEVNTERSDDMQEEESGEVKNNVNSKSDGEGKGKGKGNAEAEVGNHVRGGSPVHDDIWDNLRNVWAVKFHSLQKAVRELNRTRTNNQNNLDRHRHLDSSWRRSVTIQSGNAKRRA